MQLSAQDYAEIVATLQAAEADGSDKRRFTRMQVRGRIVVTPITDGHAGTSYTALTRDISFQGAGIMQTIPVQLGQNVLLYLPRRGRPILCVLSKVVHVRPLADGLVAVGCEFLAPAEPGAAKAPQTPDAAGEMRKDTPAEPPAAAAAASPTPATPAKPAPAAAPGEPRRAPAAAAR
jgi:hypothetical protein